MSIMRFYTFFLIFIADLWFKPAATQRYPEILRMSESTVLKLNYSDSFVRTTLIYKYRLHSKFIKYRKKGPRQS